jgi:high-affinity Fe2+/Pb2+ permease
MFVLILASVFFATLVWLLIDSGLGSVTNAAIMQDILLFILAAVLGTGMCWSHIRRRLTGQSDVDDID